MAAAQIVNVTDLIDERPMSAVQILVVILCGCINLLDGMDSQSIGIVAPLVAASLDIKLSSFGPIFAAAQLGAAVGAMTFGMIGDRWGRKRTLAAATILFGLFTILTARAGTYNELLTYRFMAGLGLGGATPCFLSLTAEYTPDKIRSSCVSVLWAFYPLGGMIGGFLNGWLLHKYDWRYVFWLGGTLPLFVAVALLIVAPESVRFLMARKSGDKQIRRIVARLFPDVIGPETRFVGREAQLGGVPFWHLFREGRTPVTLLLWLPLALGFGALAVAVLWAPTLLHMAGISPSTASIIIGVTGLGGFIGNGISGRLLDRFGVLAVPVPCLFLGAIVLTAFGFFSDNAIVAGLCGFLTNFTIGLGMTSGLVIASSVYPTAIRSTGVGWAMAAGRYGQVFAPAIAGITLGWGWSGTEMMALTALGPLIGALAMLCLPFYVSGWSRPPRAVPVGHSVEEKRT
jgi:AAHS family 4-hydroxybenzoate transporter-like MFS transporter